MLNKRKIIKVLTLFMVVFFLNFCFLKMNEKNNFLSASLNMRKKIKTKDLIRKGNYSPLDYYYFSASNLETISEEKEENNLEKTQVKEEKKHSINQNYQRERDFCCFL
jgi:exopolysaccharide biosynthesis protein